MSRKLKSRGGGGSGAKVEFRIGAQGTRFGDSGAAAIMTLDQAKRSGGESWLQVLVGAGWCWVVLGYGR